MLGEPGQLVEGIDHGVQGVGDDDAEGLGGMGLDAVGDILDDGDVGGEQVLAGHPGDAGLAGGDDDHVGARDVRVIAGADDVGVVVAVRRHLHQVKGLAFDGVHKVADVEDDDVTELLHRGQHGQVLADLSAADKSDLFSLKTHIYLLVITI